MDGNVPTSGRRQSTGAGRRCVRARRVPAPRTSRGQVSSTRGTGTGEKRPGEGRRYTGSGDVTTVTPGETPRGDRGLGEVAEIVPEVVDGSGLGLLATGRTGTVELAACLLEVRTHQVGDRVLLLLRGGAFDVVVE